MKPLFACSQRAQVECLDQKKCFKSRDTVSITKNLIHCLAQPLRGSLCTVSMFSMNHNALYVHLEQSTYDRLMRWISVLFRDHAVSNATTAGCLLSSLYLCCKNQWDRGGQKNRCKMDQSLRDQTWASVCSPGNTPIADSKLHSPLVNWTTAHNYTLGF